MSEKISKKLLCQNKNGYDRISEAERNEMNAYCEEYKEFLAKGCTERECVDETIRLARERGYRELKRGEKLQPGDKVYRVEAGKAIALAVIGAESLEQGVVISGAHIDNPVWT